MNQRTGIQYEILVRGRLGPAMQRWFANLDVTASGPDETRLVGWFDDQADLHRLLSELADLGLELAGVSRLSAPGEGES